MFRTCTRCEMKKEINKFHKINGGRNHRKICGKCRTEKAAEYMFQYYNKKLDATGKTRKSKTGKIKFFEGSNLV